MGLETTGFMLHRLCYSLTSSCAASSPGNSRKELAELHLPIHSRGAADATVAAGPPCCSYAPPAAEWD